MANVTLRDIGKFKSLWERFSKKAYREAFAEARLREAVAAQVYFIRESRKLTQGDLADMTDTKQPAISRIENGSGGLNIGTLQKIAKAFDVALSVKFVPYSELADELVSGRIESYVAPFEDDVPATLVPAGTQDLPKLRFSSWADGDDTMIAVASPPRVMAARAASYV